MASFGILVLFGFEVLTAIPITSLLCRYQLSHKKRISFAMAFAGALGMPIILSILALCLDSGLWSSEPFTYRDAHIEFYVFGFGLLAILSLLPALAVVIYYRIRSK
jgi:hypothetical protein